MDKNQRAKPLAPDKRRRAIIEAVLPLLVERSATITTREIAEAAEVAEGTLFKVFPDKYAIILAAIEHQLDPEPLRVGLQNIDVEASLEAQLIAAARVITENSEEASALFAVLRTMPPASNRPIEPPTFIHTWGEAVTSGVTTLLEPHQESLCFDHDRVAAAFVALLFTRRHPLAKPQERMSVTELVKLLLYGALDSKAASASPNNCRASTDSTERRNS
ncbi:MAG: TetR/AcrR family transcriptional regulator [Trueperaceae bacterium]|nr:TetR/AcrR family transcriptional regulator [Trueperaceae bacterium]